MQRLLAICPNLIYYLNRLSSLEYDKWVRNMRTKILWYIKLRLKLFKKENRVWYVYHATLQYQLMSLVSFSDNFGQISIYKNYHLQCQYISKFEYSMPTKQHATKNKSHIQIQTRYTRDIFCGGRGFSRKCSKSSGFINSVSWNSIQHIFISRGAVFLMR